MSVARLRFSVWCFITVTNGTRYVCWTRFYADISFMIKIIASALWVSILVAQAAKAEPVDLGSRLELFVDQHLVEKTENIDFVMHPPVRQPMAKNPLPVRHMVTVLKDGDRYRAYWREADPNFTGVPHSGHPGELVRYAESDDGHEWTTPSLGLYEIAGSRENNVVLAKMPPYLTNFMPFIDTRPGVPDEERYKAVAGYPGPGDKREWTGDELDGRGLHAFYSADGIHWENRGEIIPYQPGWRHAFDSPNVAFWSEAEGQYVCYFRTWTAPERLRSISRTTSSDFITWSDPVAMDPNLPGEHLYTNMTSPYHRAPHIYLALPTRFLPGRGDAPSYDQKDINATDIMFMSSRAGSETYDRPFKTAFIRPGLDQARWGNRANYVANNIVPTSPEELSIYHRSGHRYVLRTDGFVSATAGANAGELTTTPITFAGDDLVLNYSTTAAGDMRVEIQDVDGRPIPGFTLDDCKLIIGDRIEGTVSWDSDAPLASLAGQPVRLRFVMTECDLFSYRFR